MAVAEEIPMPAPARVRLTAGPDTNDDGVLKRMGPANSTTTATTAIRQRNSALRMLRIQDGVRGLMPQAISLWQRAGSGAAHSGIPLAKDFLGLLCCAGAGSNSYS